MHRRQWLCTVWLAFIFWAPVVAADEAPLKGAPEPEVAMLHQAIVQIGGRFCEYHRKDVERALRRYGEVRSVEFLNDHGTVLVRYESGGVSPAELAESAMKAAFGTGCKAWVDRGGFREVRS
jgi:hypothetical protein